MYDPFAQLLELSSRFPETIATIFAFKRKKDLVKHLADLTITREDIARAAYSATVSGYCHELKHFEYVPAHLNQQVRDVGRLLSDRKVKKACGIISGIFGQRRLSVAHLFERSDQWHIFYFDQRDMVPGDDNHWVNGAHIHFVNHLWANLRKDDVWKSLAGRSNKAYGVHVRFNREK